MVSISLCFTTSIGESPFELKGYVKEKGSQIKLSKISVSVWKNGEMISRGKTDKYGDYVIPLSKTGMCQLMAGSKNKYFHANKVKEFNILTTSTYTKNFELEIDKQVLQHECARMREMYNHMIKNPKNLDYKRAYFVRFPDNATELELFFSEKIKETNLKTYAKVYFEKFFSFKIVGKSSYMKKFIEFGAKTDMSIADKWTKKYYKLCSKYIIDNPDDLFRIAQLYTKKDLTNFFHFLISGGSFGKKKPKNYFDHLEEKYPTIYAIWLDSFESF